jgi:hypothetical protein
MKRPAFQFYAKDWRGNLKLRRCSDAAKGAWIEIMCVLHDSEEYGVWRYPLKELIAAAGIQARSAKELVEKGVLKGSDKRVDEYVFIPRHAGKAGEPVILIESGPGPVWYCSRFVRDEYKRATAGAETRFKPTKPPGGSTPPSTPSPRDGGHLGDGSAVASASALPATSSGDSSTTEPAHPATPGSATPPNGHPGGSAPQWWTTDQGWITEGARIGVKPGIGEAMPTFKDRVREARELEKRQRKEAA